MIIYSFLVNNNEINVIIGSYLSLWKEHTENNYVLKSTILKLFKKECENYISYFFVDDKVSCNDYVLFICFFLFYNTVDIVTVLVSICGATSNLLITKDKMDLFFKLFSIEKNYYDVIIELMNERNIEQYDSDVRVYSLKTFVMYVADSYSILSSLNNVKQNIMKLTFSQNDYENIMSKRNYYYYINNMFSIVYTRKESCYDKLYRLLFTNKPKPFYYNFSTKNPLDREEKHVIYKIRGRYGYSKRNSSTFFNTITQKSCKLHIHHTCSIISCCKVSPSCKFDSNTCSV